jgi:hypothetical protein
MKRSAQMEGLKMIPKHPVKPQRVRRIPNGFGWVDHRLARERLLTGLSHRAMALYLLLVTVADGEGLSYWSEHTICETLDMSSSELRDARMELERADLVAYAEPIYQALSLPAREAVR